MHNRLKDSASPYLWQHQDNPIHWQIWDSEALQLARTQNKPIFLSVGYSSCHWCHVMERESFSDLEIAQVLNELFIPIKVDREERPDLDHLYMQSVQMMTGSGGWPLNVFLTPDLRPFFGGTYFPREARFGKPPFRELLLRVNGIFHQHSDEVRKNSDQVTALVVQEGRHFEKIQTLDSQTLELVEKNIRNNLDRKWGGLGRAPKFFYSDGLMFLLKRSKEKGDSQTHQEVLDGLKSIALGGVFDQMGGGFHRYSTDAEWKVPHFEKMLYDNALLMRLYAEAFAVSGDAFFRDIVMEIADWLFREMLSPEGAFYSSLDADTHHEEGAYYVWMMSELRSRLSAEELGFLTEIFGLTEEGNFEGKQIFHFEKRENFEEIRRAKNILRKLLPARNEREHPHLDQKILTSWNALTISSLALAGRSLGVERFVEVAEKAAEVLWSKVWVDQKLKHGFLGERVQASGFLEDYAHLSEAFLDLYEITKTRSYLERAKTLAQTMLEEFYDSEEGGFWATPESQIDILARYKEIHDGAVPAAYHVALSVCLRLYLSTSEDRWHEVFEKSAKAIGGNVKDGPGGFNRWAIVMDAYLNQSIQCRDGDCSVSTLQKSS